jgi:hypothetical protein
VKALTLIALQIAMLSFAVNPLEVPEFTQQGNLVTLRVIPKDRAAKIYLIGHKAAEADFRKNAKILKVSLIDHDKREELKIDKQGDYYEIKGLPSRAQPYRLNIQTKVQGQIEDFDFQIPSERR